MRIVFTKRNFQNVFEQGGMTLKLTMMSMMTLVALMMVIVVTLLMMAIMSMVVAYNEGHCEQFSIDKYLELFGNSSTKFSYYRDVHRGDVHHSISSHDDPHDVDGISHAFLYTYTDKKVSKCQKLTRDAHYGPNELNSGVPKADF